MATAAAVLIIAILAAVAIRLAWPVIAILLLAALVIGGAALAGALLLAAVLCTGIGHVAYALGRRSPPAGSGY